MKNKKNKSLNQNIHEELDELKKEHQVKSHWYYIFWGTMAAAVVGGQIYVGLGYREMAEATKDIAIQITCSPEYTPSFNKLNKVREFE